MASGQASSPRTEIGSPYQGRIAALATMHGKQDAVAPVLRESIGLALVIPEGIDTDVLGTFTGEVPRRGTMKEVAVAKARLGMTATGLPMGIASEGTYGPHPYIPFISGGAELLVLVDDERGIVVSEYLIDEDTNFSHVITDNIEDISDFLARAQFPEHGLVVRPNLPVLPGTASAKGIRKRSELESAIARTAVASSDGRALVQTDMRAHYNPTRMSAIRRLSDRLAQRILSLCPSCASPGFGLVRVVNGLPCEICRGPSTLVDHELFGCASCDHQEQRARPDGRTSAKQVWCSICNP